MRVTFDQDSVRRYSFTHGHAPRGRGGWAFQVTWDAGVGNYMTSDLRTYTEAKADAMRFAKDHAPNGSTRAAVAVCP